MNEDFTIVLAESAEQIRQVSELFEEYRASLDVTLCFESFKRELAELPGAYAKPSGSLLLALCGSRPAGCVALRRLEQGICEMKRLYVRPAFRGQGLGKELLDAILAEGRVCGYSKMRLDTIASVMKAAVGLYRSRGFREIAPYTHDRIAGAIYLELSIEDAR